MKDSDPCENQIARSVQASEGYCDLGMWLDGWKELDNLPAPDRASPQVFHLRLRIFVGMERFESAAALAESMVLKGDRTPETWLQGSWSIRRSRSLAEARAFLIRAESFLGDEAMFQYNLACYDCQLGDTDAAKARLTRAFELDQRLKIAALEDEDLFPVW